jgi:hypothetical protein
MGLLAVDLFLGESCGVLVEESEGVDPGEEDPLDHALHVLLLEPHRLRAHLQIHNIE